MTNRNIYDFSLQRGNSILYFSVVKVNRKIEKFLNALKVLKTILNWVLYSPINTQNKLDYPRKDLTMNDRL